MKANVMPKIWYCQVCKKEIGNVVYGQLVIENVKANTDGSNLVVRCPHCGAIKTWYTNDRLSAIIDEIAHRVAQIIDKSNRNMV